MQDFEGFGIAEPLFLFAACRMQRFVYDGDVLGGAGYLWLGAALILGASLFIIRNEMCRERESG